MAGQYCTVTAYSLYLSVTGQRDGQDMKHGQEQIGMSHEVVGHLKQSDLLEDVNQTTQDRFQERNTNDC